MSLGATELALLALLVVGTVLVVGRIVVRAGYPRAYALLALVPGANLVALVAFALVEWPVERELRELRQVPR